MNQRHLRSVDHRRAFYWRARRVVLAGILSMLTVASQAAPRLDIFDQVPTRFAYVNGVTLAYQRFGDADDVPLLLIMGLGKPLTYWGEPFVSSLVDQGFQVVAFDNRDAGLSQRFDAFGVRDLATAAALLEKGGAIQPPYSLNDMADDAAALLEYLELSSAHVIGASLGGMIGQQLTLRYPEYVRSLVSIMSTDGSAQPSDDAIEIYAEAVLPDGPRDAVIDNEIALSRFDSGPNDDAFDPNYARDRITRDYNRSHGWTGAGRQFLAAMADFDRRTQVTGITRPTLVLHGDMDPYFPLDSAMSTAARIPTAQLVVIEGMGHSLEPALVPQIVTAIAHHVRRHEDAR